MVNRQALNVLREVRLYSALTALYGNVWGEAEDTVQGVTASASTAVCDMFRSIWGHPPRKDVSNHWQVFWLMVVDTHRLPKMISCGRQPDRFSGIKACINHLQLRAQLRIC